MTDRRILGTAEWVWKNLTDNMRAALLRLDAEGSIAATGSLRLSCEGLRRRGGLAIRERTEAGVDVWTITELGREVAVVGREEQQ